MSPHRIPFRSAGLLLALLWAASAATAQECPLATPEGFAPANCPSPPPPPRGPPEVSPAPHHSGWRDVSHGAATASYTTPAYVSRNEDRSLTLFFSSGQARPRGLLQVDAVHTGTELPNRMSIRARNAAGAWVTFTTGSQEIFFAYGGGGPHRLSAQFDASALPTGSHVYNVVVRSWWSDGSFQEAPVRQLRASIVNARTSPLGLGWSIAGMQRLHEQADGVFVVDGGGTASWFRGTRGSGYSAPQGDFSVVAWTGSGWTRRYPDGTVATFATSGLLQRVEDRFGNRTSFAYDGSQRLTTVTDPAGLQIRLGYAGGGLAWVRDPAGRQVDTSVNGGVLFRFIDPDGAAGLDLDFLGDQLLGYWGRAQDRAQGAERGWSFAYDAHGTVERLQAPRVTVHGDSVVRPALRFVSLESAVLPEPGRGSAATPATARPASTVRTRMTSPLGHTTRFAVDRFGLPTRIEAPLGRVTSVTRNVHGQVLSETVPSGSTTSYSWVGVQLRSITESTTGSTVQISYENTYNQVLTVTGDALYRRNVYSADRKRLVASRSGADSALYETRYTHDARGRVTQIEEPGDRRTLFHYDGTAWQNLDSVRVGIQTLRRTAYRFDALGRTRWVKSPANDSTRTDFDAIGRPTRVVDPLGQQTTMQYGRAYLERVTDAQGQAYRFQPNLLGWVERETDPRGKHIRYTYDREGNLRGRRNRLDQEVRFTYDALGRTLSRVQAAENHTTTWQYDAQDRWVRIHHPHNQDTVHFDAAGRVTRQSTRGYRIESVYDRRDLRTELRLAPQQLSVGYTYDHHQKLRAIRGLNGQVTRIRYDPRGLPIADSLPTGLRTGYTYSSVLRATGIQYNDAGTQAALGLAYAQNQRGDVQHRYNANFTERRAFSYDAASRLTRHRDERPVAGGGPSPGCPGGEARHPDTGQPCHPNMPSQWEPSAPAVNYTYDAVGNRTDRGAAIGTGNRLTQVAGHTLQYDDEGRLTRRTGPGFSQTYTWNSLDQLTGVTTNGLPVSYRYDGLGRLVRRTNPGGTHRYVYDGDDLFVETIDTWPEPHRVWTHYPGVDRPHGLRQWTPWSGMTHLYYATDELGSVTGMIGGTQPVSQYRYDPWGNFELHQEGTNIYNPLLFAARYRDWDSGLYYNRNRWYDPHLGRFISEDPIRLGGGINLYAYAANNPVNARDPYGLCTIRKVRIEGSHGVFGELSVKDDNCRSGGSAGFGNRRGTGFVPIGGGSRRRSSISLQLIHVERILRADSPAPCVGALSIASLSTVGDVTIGGAVARIGGFAVRGVAHAGVGRTVAAYTGRDMTPQGAQFMRQQLEHSVIRSNAFLNLAVNETSLAGGAAAEGFAGGLNHVVSAQNTSPWDFVPVVGTYRAWRSTTDACSGI